MVSNGQLIVSVVEIGAMAGYFRKEGMNKRVFRETEMSTLLAFRQEMIKVRK